MSEEQVKQLGQAYSDATDALEAAEAALGEAYEAYENAREQQGIEYAKERGVCVGQVRRYILTHQHATIESIVYDDNDDEYWVTFAIWGTHNIQTVIDEMPLIRDVR